MSRRKRDALFSLKRKESALIEGGSKESMRTMIARIGLAMILWLLGSGMGAFASQESPNLNVAKQLESQFVEVAQRVGPAVVSISAEMTERLRVRRYSFGGSPFSEFDDDVFDHFFRDFFGEAPEGAFKQRGLGTGVIIDEEGYILTNEHVIHGADKVIVTLPDGRELPGQIKGTDIRSDLAIIKVDAKNLPAAELGDSDQVKIGQWAIAVGNPFGFAVGGTEGTGTVGVISALNRSLRVDRSDRDYSNLIQTDAAINPGNSGGPLVNLEGKVIGINVAIYSTTGGYQGVGFAIPSNAAKAVLGDLIQGKKVLYGWLGVNVQDLTEELSKQFGLDSREGVIVAQILPGSPAEKGGLKEGDVIRTYDGERIKDVRELLKRVARTRVGKKVNLGLVRDRREMSLSVEAGERPNDLESWEARGEGTWRGLEISRITSELAQRYQLEGKNGVVVTHVEPGSAADEAGLRVGDLILEINRKRVASVNDFRNMTQAVKGDVLIKTARGYAVVRNGNGK